MKAKDMVSFETSLLGFCIFFQTSQLRSNLGTWAGKAGKPCQKEAQLSEQNHLDLHDLTCLWLFVKKAMSASFPGEVVERHQELFDNGHLGLAKKKTNLVVSDRGWPKCFGRLFCDWSPKSFG